MQVQILEEREWQKVLSSNSCAREVPLHSTKLAGIEMLLINGDIIFGEDDPSKICCTGKPYSIIDQPPKNLRLSIKVPFTEKQDFDIKRLGK